MKNPLSLRLLYLISEIAFWCTLLLIVILLFLTGMSLLDRTLDLDLGYGVNVASNTEVSYFTIAENLSAELVITEGTFKIPMKHLDKKTLVYSFSAFNLLFGCILYISYSFRSFMKQVLNGKTFDLSSIRLIRKIAIGLVALECILFLYNNFVYLFISTNIISEFSMSRKISFPSTALIVALCLWVLAHIFTKAKELVEEQRLTV